ncbi:hypothetical protein Gotur_028517 [Gossypium turneri]
MSWSRKNLWGQGPLIKGNVRLGRGKSSNWGSMFESLRNSCSKFQM